jgi:short-subunit dehydrogenase
VELNSRFERKTAAEIDQIIATNVIAPMQLTRLILPGMLARRRGHIVNLGSLAGKLGTPFGSVYGASKAAVMAWSWALHAELGGTGVGVSMLNPGLVSDTGFFAYHRTAPHILLGQVTPQAVVQALLRAITQDMPAVDVYPWLFKSYELLNLFSPAAVMFLQRVLGVRDWLKRTYDKEPS